jgi:hypothetical protein
VALVERAKRDGARIGVTWCEVRPARWVALLPGLETGHAGRIEEVPAGKTTMSGARRLACIGALLLVAAIVMAGALLLAEVACPSLAAAVGNPWFRAYHMGENPWAGAWPPAGASLAASLPEKEKPVAAGDGAQNGDEAERQQTPVQPFDEAKGRPRR